MVNINMSFKLEYMKKVFCVLVFFFTVIGLKAQTYNVKRMWIAGEEVDKSLFPFTRVEVCNFVRSDTEWPIMKFWRGDNVLARHIVVSYDSNLARNVDSNPGWIVYTFTGYYDALDAADMTYNEIEKLQHIGFVSDIEGYKSLNKFYKNAGLVILTDAPVYAR